MALEFWKPIPDVGVKAEISSLGRVRVYDVDTAGYRIEQGIKLPSKGKGGRKVVSFPGGRFMVHKLVADAFIPNSHGHTHIVFADGDESNCQVSNLLWVKYPKIADRGLKLSDDDIATIKQRRRAGETCASIAKHFGVVESHVWRICK